MKKRTRRMTLIKTIALLLAICMIIPLLPIEAIAATSAADLTADETEQTAQTEETAKTDEEIIASLLEPIIVEEDVTKRRENEKHFLCDDGSYIAISYSEAVHEEVNGEWVDIEYDVTDDGSDISPVDEDIKVKFANNTNSSKLVKIEADGYKLSWTVEAETENGEGINKVKLSKESKSALKTTEEINKQNREKIKKESKNNYAQVLSHKLTAESALERMDLANTAEPEKNEAVVRANQNIETYNREQIQSAASYAQSMVEYKDVFGEGMTLRYLLSPGKINEEVVLDSLNGFKSYSMLIDTDGLTPIVTETGRVDLTDEEGNVIMTIDPPYMYDSIDAISENISVTAEQESKKEWRITYTPNAEWLADTSRVYPVVIDPEAAVTTQNRVAPSIFDTYVYEGQTTAVDTSSYTLKVGYQNGAEHIIYWHYDNNPPYVPVGYTMTRASFNIRLQTGTTTIGTMRIHDCSDYYDIEAFTWDNRPNVSGYDAVVSDFPTDLWIRFSSDDFTNEIEYLQGQAVPMPTFAIKYAYEVNDYNWFYSNDYRPSGSTEYVPYIAVHYNSEDDTVAPDTDPVIPEPDNPSELYPEGCTTELESGIYIIESLYNGRYLHHTDRNNTVNVWSYSDQPYQKWFIQKNNDNTYSFVSQSTDNPNLSMEVYYGGDRDTQPITMYNYENNTTSKAYRFYIIKNSDYTYSIMPAVSATRVLEVYTGDLAEITYNTRVFTKLKGQSVQLNEKKETINQKWSFQKLSDFSWDSSLPSGTYYIKNNYYNKYLDYYPDENIARVNDYDSSYHQRWVITNLGNGVYTMQTESKDNYYLEVHYGVNQNGQPIKVTSYAQNTNSPYIKMKLILNSDGTYKISPIISPTRTLTIYSGAEYTATYEGRSFTKVPGEFVELYSNSGITTQNWILIPTNSTNQTRYIAPEEESSFANLSLLNNNSFNQNYYTTGGVRWSSTNSRIASVDHRTGKVTGVSSGVVTIEARVGIQSDNQIVLHYTLVVTELPNGIYYVKNKETSKFVDINGEVSVGTQIVQNEYKTDGSQKWEFIRYEDDYYTIKYANSSGSYYLELNNDNMNAVLNVGQITDGMKWKISNSSSGAFVLTSKNSVNNYIDNCDIFNESTYTLTINAYFDNGYSLKNGFTSEESIEVIGDILQDVADFYYREFDLNISISVTNFNSSLDSCKGELTIEKLFDECACYTNEKHTDLLIAADDFNEMYPGNNRTTNIFFTGHTLSTLDSEKNFSISYENIIVINDLRTEDYVIDTIIHEMAHQVGAPDHYHLVDNDRCLYADYCSQCGINKRDMVCIMYDSEEYTVFCSECKADVKTHLADHHY